MNDWVSSERAMVVMTTINDPPLLSQYYLPRCSNLLVVGDQKSPHQALRAHVAEALAAKIGAFAHHVHYLAPQDQEKWTCSACIGWNSIQRRNIGFITACAMARTEFIISVDDDNYPLWDYQKYVAGFARALNKKHAVAVGWNYKAHAGLAPGWFDIGSQLVPPAKQRGVPQSECRAEHVGFATAIRVGVAQGMCLGDPDIDAATRYTRPEQVHSMTELARNGFVVAGHDPQVWNSQNTAVRIDLLPAWGMVPFVGRMDDIYASLVCQRVMERLGYVAHYGAMPVFQNRNPHGLVRDMRAEIAGYELVDAWWSDLHRMKIPDQSPLQSSFANVAGAARYIWENLSDDLLRKSCIDPANADRLRQAMLAYVNDCETAYAGRAK